MLAENDCEEDLALEALGVLFKYQHLEDVGDSAPDVKLIRERLDGFADVLSKIKSIHFVELVDSWIG